MFNAVLDLGTNTFSLLIFDTSSHHTILQLDQAVILGEGGLNSGISEVAQKRAFACLQKFKQVMHQYQAKNYLALGTSALRSAPNANTFIQQIKQQCGISVLVIDGQLEAQLIFDGVINHASNPKSVSLVMDIGGGSVEFCIGSKDKLHWYKSYEIGCARLLALQPWHNPPTAIERDNLSLFINHELTELFLQIKQQPITTFIGAAGSFKSLHTLAAHDHNNPSNILNFETFLSIQHRVFSNTLKVRNTWLGLEGFKAEMIPYALLLIYNVWIKLPDDVHLHVATQSLKDGVIIHQNKFLWHPF